MLADEDRFPLMQVTMRETLSAPPPKGAGQNLTFIAPKAPLDINITLIFYMFTTALCFTMVGILVAAIPYYDYLGAVATRDGLIGTGIGAIFLYTGLLVSLSFAQKALVITFGIAWGLCFSLFAGFVAASVYNIAPLQCFLVGWAQALAMIVYTRMSPQKMDVGTAAAVMLFASAVVWCASIYGFVVENDWVVSGVMVVWACLLVAYNVWQIKQIKNKYNLTWEDGVMVCAQYYCPV